MAYDRPVLTILPRGDGYINKQAAEKFNLNSGDHINIFINHRNEAIIYKDWTGYSLHMVAAGLRFKSQALAVFLNLTETRVFTIVSSFTPENMQMPDPESKICTICDRLKKKSNFKVFKGDYALSYCEDCRRAKQNEKARNKRKNLQLSL